MINILYILHVHKLLSVEKGFFDPYVLPLQVLVFPTDSLISEFGGALGLFLGFSFIGLSDELRLVAKLFNYLREQKENDNM